MHIYIYIYIYLHKYVYTYIYIYIERERCLLISEIGCHTNMNTGLVKPNKISMWARAHASGVPVLGSPPSFRRNKRPEDGSQKLAPRI